MAYASDDLYRTDTLDEALRSIVWVNGDFARITATTLISNRKQSKPKAKCLETLLRYIGFILKKVV